MSTGVNNDSWLIVREFLTRFEGRPWSRLDKFQPGLERKLLTGCSRCLLSEFYWDLPAPKGQT
jgi:hypothetical protein